MVTFFWSLVGANPKHRCNEPAALAIEPQCRYTTLYLDNSLLCLLFTRYVQQTFALLWHLVVDQMQL